MLLRLAFGLDDKVGRAEQHITEHDAERDEHGERREPVEGTAGEALAVNTRAGDQSAQGEALAQRRDQAADAESIVPQPPLCMLAILEGDAAEDQGEDHHHDRQVKRVEHDAVGQRESAEQRAAEHDQPALIGVPNAAEARHHDAAALVFAHEKREHADAEIEAVEHDVEGEEEAEKTSQTSIRKRCTLVHRRLPQVSRAPARWPSGDNLRGSCGGAGRVRSGPLRTIRQAKMTKVTSSRVSIRK